MNQLTLLENIRQVRRDYKQSIQKTFDKCVSTLDFQCMEYCLLLGANINNMNYGLPIILRIYVKLLQELPGSKILKNFSDYFHVLTRDIKYDILIPKDIHFSFIYNKSASTITSVYMSYYDVCTPKIISKNIAIHSFFIQKTTVRNVMNSMHTILSDNCPDMFEKNPDLSLIIKQLSIYSYGSVQLGELLYEDDDISHLCKICITNIKDTILIPCGHYIACSECIDVHTKCPLCRTLINSSHKVFE